MRYTVYILSVILLFFISCANDNGKTNNAIKAQISDFEVNEASKAHKGMELVAGDKMLLDVYSTVERLNFSVSLQTLSDTTTIAMGREGGGYIELTNDSVSVYRLDKTLQGYELHESMQIPWNKYNAINIECNKLNSHLLEYSITTTDTIFTIVYDKNKLDPTNRRVALGWGKPFLEIKSGSAKIKDAIASSKYNNNTKLTIIGDSFIEGATMIDYGLENRWSALLAKHIGEDDVPIIGKGGEQIDASFLERFKIENSWYNSPYVIISLGTNNSDVEEYKTSMKMLVDYLKQNGQIPILVTITPRPQYDYESTTKPINEWIRASGLTYIDMHKAMIEENQPDKWKNDYVQADGVHPSPQGHMAMFRQIKIDCPFVLGL